MPKCACGESLVIKGNVCVHKDCGQVSDVTITNAFQIKMRCKKCTPMNMCGVPVLLCSECTKKGLTVSYAIGDGMVRVYKGDDELYSYRQY